MSSVKKVPKKLRGGPVIFVDAQILRRRKMLAEKGIVLGKASRYREKANSKQREERSKPTPAKRKWF